MSETTLLDLLCGSIFMLLHSAAYDERRLALLRNNFLFIALFTVYHGSCTFVLPCQPSLSYRELFGDRFQKFSDSEPKLSSEVWMKFVLDGCLSFCLTRNIWRPETRWRRGRNPPPLFFFNTKLNKHTASKYCWQRNYFKMRYGRK